MLIHSVEDIDRNIAIVLKAAKQTTKWLKQQGADPIELLRQIKFDPVGWHPIEERKLNLIEQVNQTWTYLAALAAARQLLMLHPDAGGFRLAPGANAYQELDVMSVHTGLVGAETFAAVRPDSNEKLKKDLKKLKERSETFRYVFFISPRHPGICRLPHLDADGIQVWSVDFPDSRLA